MSHEKRRHPRVAFQGTIFIELVSRGNDGKSNDVVMCKTTDISKSGLSVDVNRELPVGAILSIGVDLSDSRETLYLAGEVKWCFARENSADTWRAGFELMNATDSDIQAWRKVLVAMGSNDS
ncbi:MAG: PilZ domain-containing protein [Halioglobus sp.]